MAVAPEIYARITDLSKVTDNSQIGPIVTKKPDAELYTDLDSTLAWAARNKGDANHMGEIGRYYT
jgi:carboxymethylenebutenolidase